VLAMYPLVHDIYTSEAVLLHGVCNLDLNRLTIFRSLTHQHTYLPGIG